MLETILSFTSEFVSSYINMFTEFEFTFNHISMMIALTIWMVSMIGFYSTLSYLILSGIGSSINNVLIAARKAILSIDAELREEVRS